ncbi:UNVERIFIED_CONTAM: hypothetical protein FKN15_051126 [Acipenser sinensis]
MLSIAAYWGAASFSSGIEVVGVPEPPAEEEPSFEVASEASAPLLSDSTSALKQRDAAFLQVPWTTAAEPCCSVFWSQAMSPRPQIPGLHGIHGGGTQYGILEDTRTKL